VAAPAQSKQAQQEQERLDRIEKLKAARANAPKVGNHKTPKKFDPLPETAASLEERATLLVDRAVSLEEMAESCHAGLERRVGRALVEKLGDNGKMEPFVQSFDRNDDKAISRMEFRLLVRNGLDCKANNAPLDDLFGVIDVENMGAVKPNAVSNHLKDLYKLGLKTNKEADQLKKEADALRARAERVREVQTATADFEKSYNDSVEATPEEHKQRKAIQQRQKELLNKERLAEETLRSNGSVEMQQNDEDRKLEAERRAKEAEAEALKAAERAKVQKQMAEGKTEREKLMEKYSTMGVMKSLKQSRQKSRKRSHSGGSIGERDEA